MTRYRVTYTECTLRVRFVEAQSGENAEEIVDDEIPEGVHHHMLDHWIDDLIAKKVAASEPETKGCCECCCN